MEFSCSPWFVDPFEPVARHHDRSIWQRNPLTSWHIETKEERDLGSPLRVYLQVCEFAPERLHFMKVCILVLPWVETKPLT